jgi:CheY-like chemotaxis protein
MKNSPALPGGLSKSKPTWENISKMFPTSAFLFPWHRQIAAGRMPMDNSASVMAQCPGENSFAIPDSNLRSEGRHAKPNGTGLRVLLVEGDTDSAECTSLLLQIDGHQVQVAQNGQAALQMAQAAPPDVVLLEIRLPGMDGWEVARGLQERATEKKPICIAFTTCGTEADQRRSKEAGIHLHLVKPLQSGHLRTVLRRFQNIIKDGELAPSLPKANCVIETTLESKIAQSVSVKP